MNNNNCILCNNEVTGFIKTKCLDGYICKGCYKKTSTDMTPSILKGMKKDEVEKNISKTEIQKKRASEFNSTKKVADYFFLDEQKEQWAVKDNTLVGKMNNIIMVFNYDDILEYELIEDGESVTKGGIGKAVAGGILFGGVGAIVGSVTGKKQTRNVATNIQVKITINDVDTPFVYIQLLNREAGIGSPLYISSKNNAQEILFLLTIIQNNFEKRNESIENETKDKNPIEQIKGLKELLDIGAITQEEFDTKKKQLLNL